MVRADRPVIPPEHLIVWAGVRTVVEARAQHDAYVASIRARESLITGYVVVLEGRLFVCSNNAAWIRDFFAGLPQAR